MMKSVLQFAHDLLADSIEYGDVVIDATCGNGNDTIYLSKLVGAAGHVYAFDIQEQAIHTTRELLMDREITTVSLVQDSHAELDQYVKEEIGAAIFNLGYLPRGDKSIITEAPSTIGAVEKILPLLKKKGILVLVVYHGHEGGAAERDALTKYLLALEQEKFQVLRYGFINQKNNPPFIYAVEKR